MYEITLKQSNIIFIVIYFEILICFSLKQIKFNFEIDILTKYFIVFYLSPWVTATSRARKLAGFAQSMVVVAYTLINQST